MTERWVVVGGGFKGIIGAHLLASRGMQVTLVEPAKGIGSVLRSVPWKGFHLDKGCHLFSHDDEISSAIMLDILGEDIEPVSVRYASVFNRVKTEGMAIPHLGGFGEDVVKQVLHELVNASVEVPPEREHLGQALSDRFGVTAARLLDEAVFKTYCVDASTLDFSALKMTQFGRIGLLPKKVADLLKQAPELDDRIASPSQDDPLRYYSHMADKYAYRSFYPKQRGLLRFCERAEASLQALGVSMLVGQGVQELHLRAKGIELTLGDGKRVSADRVLWTAGPEQFSKLTAPEKPMEPFVHSVPMVLYYFVIGKQEEGAYTYLQSFDRGDLIYRASIPGGYVQDSACPPGLSYVCCEVPTNIGSPQWTAPKDYAETVWKELQRYGVVHAQQPQDLLAVTVPSTYKLPRPGYWEAMEKVLVPFKGTRTIFGLDEWDLSMNSIARTLHDEFVAL